MRLLLFLALCMPARAAEHNDQVVRCNSGWCAIRQDALKALLTSNQKLLADVSYFEKLCGWEK